MVSVHQFGPNYPDVPLDDAALRAGLDGSPDDMAALVVLCASAGAPATVNLQAPIIVTVRMPGGTIPPGCAACISGVTPYSV